MPVLPALSCDGGGWMVQSPVWACEFVINVHDARSGARPKINSDCLHWSSNSE